MAQVDWLALAAEELGKQALSGTLPTADRLGPRPPDLSSYTPTWREAISAWLKGEGRGNAHRELVDTLIGTGSSGVGAVDFSPLGPFLGIQEGAQKGDPVSAIINALPVEAVTVPLGIAAKAGGKALKKFTAAEDPVQKALDEIVEALGIGEHAAPTGKAAADETLDEALAKLQKGMDKAPSTEKAEFKMPPPVPKDWVSESDKAWLKDVLEADNYTPKLIETIFANPELIKSHLNDYKTLQEFHPDIFKSLEAVMAEKYAQKPFNLAEIPVAEAKAPLVLPDWVPESDKTWFKDIQDLGIYTSKELDDIFASLVGKPPGATKVPTTGGDWLDAIKGGTPEMPAKPGKVKHPISGFDYDPAIIAQLPEGFQELFKPVDWTTVKPSSPRADLYANLPAMNTINRGVGEEHLRDLDFNPELVLYKGTHTPLTNEGLTDPALKDYERAFFASDAFPYARAYGYNVEPLFARAKNAYEVDWPSVMKLQAAHEIGPSASYDQKAMHRATEYIRSIGGDALITKNIGDTSVHGYEPQTQFLLFGANQLRKPEAKFDPSKLNEKDLLAAIAPFLLAPLAFQGQEE